jgi:hypothetical protein
LEKGRFWCEYVVSPWFEKHSTALDFVPDHLHILKTTINHLTIRWLSKRFPGIEFWGIWRDPFDIFASLVRNEFYGQWYLDALPQLAVTVGQYEEFPPLFSECLEKIGESEVKALAFLIAARSYFFFNYLKPEKLINYEQFKTDPNAELNKITRYFGLAAHSFEGECDKDHNIVGLGFEKGKTHRYVIGGDDGDFAAEVFAPLFALMKRRFGTGPWRNPGKGARS